jgi:predicted  nucleic acid-binding Zn-ribbon protein
MNNADEKGINCPNCGMKKFKKFVSKVAYHKSENSRIAAYDMNSPQNANFFRDTRNIGLNAKKRAMQLGVDLGNSFETKLEKLRTDPKSVLNQDD